MGCDKEGYAWCAGFLDGEGSFLLTSRKVGSIKPSMQATLLARYAAMPERRT